MGMGSGQGDPRPSWWQRNACLRGAEGSQLGISLGLGLLIAFFIDLIFS